MLDSFEGGSAVLFGARHPPEDPTMNLHFWQDWRAQTVSGRCQGRETGCGESVVSVEAYHLRILFFGSRPSVLSFQSSYTPPWPGY